jgi:hypothetical protein
MNSRSRAISVCIAKLAMARNDVKGLEGVNLIDGTDSHVLRLELFWRREKSLAHHHVAQ